MIQIIVNYAYWDIFHIKQIVTTEKYSNNFDDLSWLITKLKKMETSDCVFVEAPNHWELEDENLKKITSIRFSLETIEDQLNGLFTVCISESLNSSDTVKMNTKQLRKFIKAYTAKDRC